MDTEACFPVTRAVEMDEIKSRALKGGEVLAVLHHGPHETLKEGYRRLFGYIREHGIPTTDKQREVYLKYDPDNSEENVTEIQVFLHD